MGEKGLRWKLREGLKDFKGEREREGGGMRHFSVVSTLARDNRFFLKKKGFQF